jgi:hypothetical protein
MTRIPSIDDTDDLVFHIRPQKDPDSPANLLIFEKFVRPSGPLHSMEVYTFRDKARVHDIELLEFKHHVGTGPTFVRLTFTDLSPSPGDHDYILKLILRFIVT